MVAVNNQLLTPTLIIDSPLPDQFALTTALATVSEKKYQAFVYDWSIRYSFLVAVLEKLGMKAGSKFILEQYPLGEEDAFFLSEIARLFSLGGRAVLLPLIINYESQKQSDKLRVFLLEAIASILPPPELANFIFHHAPNQKVGCQTWLNWLWFGVETAANQGDLQNLYRHVGFVAPETFKADLLRTLLDKIVSQEKDLGYDFITQKIIPLPPAVLGNRSPYSLYRFCVDPRSAQAYCQSLSAQEVTENLPFLCQKNWTAYLNPPLTAEDFLNFFRFNQDREEDKGYPAVEYLNQPAQAALRLEFEETCLRQQHPSDPNHFFANKNFYRFLAESPTPEATLTRVTNLLNEIPSSLPPMMRSLLTGAQMTLLHRSGQAEAAQQVEKNLWQTVNFRHQATNEPVNYILSALPQSAAYAEAVFKNLAANEPKRRREHKIAEANDYFLFTAFLTGNQQLFETCLKYPYQIPTLYPRHLVKIAKQQPLFWQKFSQRCHEEVSAQGLNGHCLGVQLLNMDFSNYEKELPTNLRQTIQDLTEIIIKQEDPQKLIGQQSFLNNLKQFGSSKALPLLKEAARQKKITNMIGGVKFQEENEKCWSAIAAVLQRERQKKAGAG